VTSGLSGFDDVINLSETQINRETID